MRRRQKRDEKAQIKKRLISWTNFQIKEDLENKGRGIRFRLQDEIGRESNLRN
jgi:hypothetical protein